MKELRELYEAVRKIDNVLRGLGIRYLFTGGLAASYHGEPRFTQDVDIVIGLLPQSKEVEGLIAALSKDHVITPIDLIL